MLKNLIYLFLFFGTSLYSQNLREIDTSDLMKRQNLIVEYQTEFAKSNQALKKKYRSHQRVEILKIYKEKHQEFLKSINDDEFIFDDRFTEYCDKSLEYIQEVYPKLKNRKMKVLISRDPAMNAVSIGEGIVIVNMGLFRSLQTEAQFMSVLIHEISHDDLEHVAKTIEKRAIFDASRETKRKVRKIKRQKYNRYGTSLKLLKDLIYSSSGKRRKNELQADSLGYEIFKNTHFEPASYLSSLRLLVAYDSLKAVELDSAFYRKKFDLPNLPFDPEWLEVESFSEYDYSNFTKKIDEDSVSSHPHILDRIAYLESNFPELKNTNFTPRKNSDSFIELQRLSRKEDIVVLHDMREYGMSIYLILQKMMRNPEDAYLNKWLGINFEALYNAKKKYQFNRHVDQVKPQDQSLNYQRFLNFLWNLRLDDYKKIGEYYSSNY